MQVLLLQMTLLQVFLLQMLFMQLHLLQMVLLQVPIAAAGFPSALCRPGHSPAVPLLRIMSPLFSAGLKVPFLFEGSTSNRFRFSSE